MSIDLHFMHPSTLVTPKSPTYRPPCFPPPDDFVVSIDKERNPLSYYRDNHWNYSAFGFSGFNFDLQNLSKENLALVKQTLFFCMYHPAVFPGKISSLKAHFVMLCKIAKVCDRSGVLLNELYRFPRIHKEVSKGLHLTSITILHKLRLYHEQLGFLIADEKTLAYLASHNTAQEYVQTAYIPPRIWSYQINRLNECIDDFIENKASIEAAYNWISDAYKHNARLGLIHKGKTGYQSPFGDKHAYRNKRILFDGTFDDFLQEYKLDTLLHKWIAKSRISNRDSYELPSLTAYLTLLRDISIFYIANFSLQRIAETASLRSDCYRVEADEKLGQIAMVSGETTKTDPDSDALWIVPKTVKKAVDVASFIARLRLQHAPEAVLEDSDIVNNPYLLSPAWEPWVYTVNESKLDHIDYSNVTRRNSLVLDVNELIVTEEDYKIAVSLTPNIDKKKWFGLGKPWNFTAHQFRRTGCVNMFSSGMVTDSTLQWELKHQRRNMTYYYGRNYTNLRLNSESERVFILESYKAVYRQLVEVVEDSLQYVRPYDKEIIPNNVINLVSEREEKKLTTLIKNGSTGCRQTLLGFCLRTGSCEYGGIESVAKCAGENGICSDAIFDRRNKAELVTLRKNHKQELKSLDKEDMPTAH